MASPRVSCTTQGCPFFATGTSLVDNRPYCSKTCQPAAAIGYRNPETGMTVCDAAGCGKGALGKVGDNDYCLDHLIEEAQTRRRRRESTPESESGSEGDDAAPSAAIPEATTRAKAASRAVQAYDAKFQELDKVQTQRENDAIAQSEAIVDQARIALHRHWAVDPESFCPVCYESGYVHEGADEGRPCTREGCKVGKAASLYTQAKDDLERAQLILLGGRRNRRKKHARMLKQIYDDVMRGVY